jgi:glycerol-3-phosphate acyltransferase PlsY
VQTWTGGHGVPRSGATAWLVIEFVNLNKLLSFLDVYKDIIYIRVLIKMSTYIHMTIYVYSVFFKQKKLTVTCLFCVSIALALRHRKERSTNS